MSTSQPKPTQVEGLATPRPWRLALDAWDRVEIRSDADSQNIAAWLTEHPEAGGKTFRGVTICDSFGPKYNGSGEAFGPHEVISTEEAGANAALIVRAVNSFDALVEALRNIRSVGHVAAPYDRSAYAAALQRANDKLDQVMEWAEDALKLAEGEGCKFNHFDIEAGSVCPRCGIVIQRDGLGREVNPPEGRTDVRS